MANICDNNFLISFEDENLGKLISNKLKKLFEDELFGEITYEDEGVIEGYFESRWSFPLNIFENFFDEFSNDSIYMRCLSIEYGCEYVAMNIYRDQIWEQEQTFDL